jgi:hypothetical protein
LKEKKDHKKEKKDYKIEKKDQNEQMREQKGQFKTDLQTSPSHLDYNCESSALTDCTSVP